MPVYAIEKKGPVVPKGVNEKSFVSVKIAPMAEHTFKDGQVAKMTGGKIRLKDEGEQWKKEKSDAEYAEKGDIVSMSGACTALNESKEEAASCRVFTKNK